MHRHLLFPLHNINKVIAIDSCQANAGGADPVSAASASTAVAHRPLQSLIGTSAQTPHPPNMATPEKLGTPWAAASSQPEADRFQSIHVDLTAAMALLPNPCCLVDF